MNVGTIIRQKDGEREYGNIEHVSGEGDDMLVTIQISGNSLPEQYTKKDFDANYVVVCE